MSAVGEADLPPEAWLVALSSLPGMGPARLRAVCDDLEPSSAWQAIRDRSLPHSAPGANTFGSSSGDLQSKWAEAAALIDVVGLWLAHSELQVLSEIGTGLPKRFEHDPEAPMLLFCAGDLGPVDGPCVAIVGTRRCSQAGAELAYELGLECARAGASVVSGLAKGIDAAAHSGALQANSAAPGPIGVVATGLDVVYPRSSSRLWDSVAKRGALLSEYPLGTRPERWRFPARNRVVAALADVVVVVESARRGGSMYTVDEALLRDRTVMAVPGSIRSPASDGTNWLLSQGAQVVTSVSDVLMAAKLDDPVESKVLSKARPAAPNARVVLASVSWSPSTLDQLAVATGLGLGALAVAIEQLEAEGLIYVDGGRIERRGRR